MKRPGAHEELTDPENEKFIGTLTPRAWRLLAHKAIKARWYADYDGRQLADALKKTNISELLLHQAMQTSGSIGGEHRRDLKEAIIGAPQQSVGFSLPGQQEQKAEPPKKRGF